MSNNPKEEKDIIQKFDNNENNINEQKNIDKSNENIKYTSIEDIDIFEISKMKLQRENDIKYNFRNIDEGKQYFKERYIKEKLEEINTTIKRLSYSKDLEKEFNNPLRHSLQTLSNKLSFDNYEKETERRKCETEFLLIIEKSIISFNLKKYQESYTYLENSGVIKNLDEYGTFLLVVNGFDKSILGEFLAKEKPPNENKDIINSFVSSIDLNYKNNSFL